MDDDGKVFIYYASSDTRLHVATSTVDQLVDYCMHTAPDGMRSATSVQTVNTIIENNKPYIEKQNGKDWSKVAGEVYSW